VVDPQKPSVTTPETILALLDQVKDPEIPVLSLVDLGVITHVEITDELVFVEMTPTFVGCPAMDIMKQEVIDVLQKNGWTSKVEINFRQPWSSDKISEKGKIALKKFGLAPPPGDAAIIADIDFLEHVPCPRCNSLNTELKNPFGPTLCRSIHYCRSCRETFEQFKPVG
jgi:ring-1,2-phenylacetyl-CoA epoxidase subunit PaaD